MMSLKNKKALVFGEDTRSFLTVVRSLANAGMSVDVVAFSNTSPALQSNRIRHIYRFNHQSMTIEQWTNEIKKILLDNDYDIAVPCDERALFPLMAMKETLTVKTIFALPEQADIAPLFNKVETRKLGERCNIPVAKGDVLNLSSHTFEALKATYGLPFVLKPMQSYRAEDLNKRQCVKIAHNETDFNAFIQNNPTQNTLVESYFSGYGMGVSVLANEGEITAAFAHARVAEPESGGGSSYRKAIPVDEKMFDACQRFCQALKYTGVAMFEFKFNPQTQQWIFIEINARFWGSLPLAVNAGIDFPKMLAETLFGAKPQPRQSYNLNAYSRSFANDIYAMQKEFNSLKQKKGSIHAFTQLAKRLLGLTRIVTGNDYIDSFKWHDQKPFWYEFADLFEDKILSLPLIKSHQQKLRIKKFRQALKQRPKKEVLFICYGNIMRSPFAFELFKTKTNNSPLKQLTTGSFGFHHMINRSAKPQCIALAKDWQIDLTSHQSAWLKYEHCLNPDTLIVIMDKKNEHILTTCYPEVDYISLADLIPQSMGFHHEIADPYDKSEGYLKTCYQRIDASIDQLIVELENN